jgi:hypothetical protein
VNDTVWFFNLSIEKNLVTTILGPGFGELVLPIVPSVDGLVFSPRTAF